MQSIVELLVSNNDDYLELEKSHLDRLKREFSLSYLSSLRLPKHRGGNAFGQGNNRG